jgi:hypothetical protein
MPSGGETGSWAGTGADDTDAKSGMLRNRRSGSGVGAGPLEAITQPSVPSDKVRVYFGAHIRA